MPKLAPIVAAFLTLSLPALAAPGDPTSPPAEPIKAEPVKPERARPARTDRGVMRYDADKDGVVTIEEWRAGQQARFKRLDTNGDGKLTQDELFARTPAAGNSVLPSDRQAGRQSAYFQRLDADKDGAVALAEFMAQGERNFTRCDLDRNGRIDSAECRQALQRKPGPR